MKPEHFLNPDGLSDEALREARKFFSAMAEYCGLARTARRLRLSGDTSRALHYEALHDQLYLDMPKDWKW